MPAPSPRHSNDRRAIGIEHDGCFSVAVLRADRDRRKARPGPQPAFVATAEAREPDRTRGADDRIAELQLENSRLRRLVTDLLLERVKLEEAAQGHSSVA